jgi:glutathione synthase/RimK-type ligase-like ATP-grasp enzyme
MVCTDPKQIPKHLKEKIKSYNEGTLTSNIYEKAIYATVREIKNTIYELEILKESKKYLPKSLIKKAKEFKSGLEFQLNEFLVSKHKMLTIIKK